MLAFLISRMVSLSINSPGATSIRIAITSSMDAGSFHRLPSTSGGPRLGRWMDPPPEAANHRLDRIDGQATHQRDGGFQRRGYPGRQLLQRLRACGIIGQGTP